MISSWRVWLPLIVVLVVAALPRLIFLNHVEFRGDEGQDATIVRTMLETRTLAQVGIVNSIGTLNFPISLYLMAIPLAVSPDPRVATAFVGVLNIVAVGVTFALGRRLWGTTGATVSGLLFALSPWAVVASRKLWPPWFIPFFAACCLASIIAKRKDGSAWWVSVALICWLWACQLHPTVLLEAPVFVLAGRPFWRGVRSSHVAMGVITGLLPAVPYVVFDSSHAWVNLAGHIKSARLPAATDAVSLRMALLNLTNYQTLRLGDVPYTEFTPYGNSVYQLSTIVTVLAVLAILAMVTWCVGGVTRGLPRSEPALAGDVLVLLGWLCLPVLLTIRHGTPLYQHYYVALFPAAFLLCGGAVATAAGRRGISRATYRLTVYLPPPGASQPVNGARNDSVAHRLIFSMWRSLAPFACVGFVLVLWTALIGSFLAYLPSPRSVATIGLPLDTGAAIGRIAVRAGRSGHLWYVADARVMPMVGYMTHDVPDRQELPPDALVLPPPGSEAGYFFGDDSLAPAQALLAAGAHLGGRVVYPGGSRTAVAAVWTGQMDPGALAATLTPLSIRLTNGVEFLGASTRRQSTGFLRITYLWRVGRTSLGVNQDDLALYAHLVDATGQTRAQRDGMPFASARWQAGQTIETWFDLPLKDVQGGTYDLRSGMYRRPSIQRVSAVDSSGAERDGEFSLGQVVVP